VYVSVGWFSWSWFDWPTFSIQIVWSDASRYHNTVFVRRDADPPYWRHDPYHRRGVVYRDPGTSERFGPRRPHFAAGPGPEPRVSRPGDSAGAPRPQEWRREGNTPDRAGVEGENTRPDPRRDDGPVVTGGGRQPAPPAADRRDTVNVTRTTPEKEIARPAPAWNDVPAAAGPAPEAPRPTAARRGKVNFPWATPERGNDSRPTPVTEPAPVVTENAPQFARPEGEKRETVNFPWAGRMREIFQPDQAPVRDNFPEGIGAGLLDRWRDNRETGDARNGGTNLSRAEAPAETPEAAPPRAGEPPDRERGRVNRGNERGGRR
jgi:hypothetical protein